MPRDPCPQAWKAERLGVADLTPVERGGGGFAHAARWRRAGLANFEMNNVAALALAPARTSKAKKGAIFDLRDSGTLGEDRPGINEVFVMISSSSPRGARIPPRSRASWILSDVSGKYTGVAFEAHGRYHMSGSASGQKTNLGG